MASIGFLIGGALVNPLAFTGSNYLFSIIIFIIISIILLLSVLLIIQRIN